MEVTEGVESGVPIMVLPFVSEEDVGGDRLYSEIIAADLGYSGLFSIIPADVQAMPKDGIVNYQRLLEEGVEKMVVGEVETSIENIKVTYSLYDIVQRKRILKSEVNTKDFSHSAHYISDRIYESLTGFPGVFNTRFAFITSKRLSWRKHEFALYISDVDGHNAIPILTVNEQLMSPVWSPDAKRIAYVSYESGQTGIFIQTLATGERQTLSEYTGTATSPDWSPDGCCLAYVGSSFGNPDVYVINLNTKQIMRITDNVAIDTEPSWTPDGRLIFTSDRSGRPQLYRTDVKGSRPERITYNGKYNSDADVSADGEKITFLRQTDRGFSIMIMNRDGNQEQTLFSVKDAERPRFAANNQLISHLAFGSVSLLTVDGRLGKPIPIPISNIRGISWSPLLH